MVEYCVLWKEKRKYANSLRPEWESFKSKKHAQLFVTSLKRDSSAKQIRIKKCKKVK